MVFFGSVFPGASNFGLRPLRHCLYFGSWILRFLVILIVCFWFVVLCFAGVGVISVVSVVFACCLGVCMFVNQFSSSVVVIRNSYKGLT